jgi:hypothetical protein
VEFIYFYYCFCGFCRSDICFYDNLNEAVLAVELFRPKKDTFPVGVEYGLCISTCNNIILLAVEFIRYTKGLYEFLSDN